MSTSGPITLDQAPFDRRLEVSAIERNAQTAQLFKMGLVPRSEIIRLDKHFSIHSVHISGQCGEAVLSGIMGLKAIVQRDTDGQRVPLLEMQPGESGHIVGSTGGRELLRVMAQIGFAENDPIVLESKLPQMEYQTMLNHRTCLRLNGGDAAHILGQINGETRQFALSSEHQCFQVTKLLGGPQHVRRLRWLGIEEGSLLTLSGKRDKQRAEVAGDQQLMIVSREGLHLNLPISFGKAIFVRVLE